MTVIKYIGFTTIFLFFGIIGAASTIVKIITSPIYIIGRAYDLIKSDDKFITFVYKYDDKFNFFVYRNIANMMLKIDKKYTMELLKNAIIERNEKESSILLDCLDNNELRAYIELNK